MIESPTNFLAKIDLMAEKFIHIWVNKIENRTWVTAKQIYNVLDNSFVKYSPIVISVVDTYLVNALIRFIPSVALIFWAKWTEKRILEEKDVINAWIRQIRLIATWIFWYAFISDGLDILLQYIQDQPIDWYQVQWEIVKWLIFINYLRTYLVNHKNIKKEWVDIIWKARLKIALLLNKPAIERK